MIKKRTVLIIGAGASAPYCFPLGKQLVDIICTKLGNITQEFRTLQLVGPFTEDHLRSFVTALRFSRQQSIDAFLEHRPQFLDVGKAAIAQELVRFESPEDIFGQIDDDWYTFLLNRMNCPFDDFEMNAISIITFNYDRSLEHFLFTALSNRYGKSEQEVAAKLNRIRIIHVHGQLGLLAWQNASTKAGEVRSFAPAGREDILRIAASGIKVLSEASDESPEFAEASSLIRQAERVYFLGFGYHDDNMRRLNLPLQGTKYYDGNRLFYGTCFKFTEVERNVNQNSKYPGINLGDPGHKIVQFLRHQDHFLIE